MPDIDLPVPGQPPSWAAQLNVAISAINDYVDALPGYIDTEVYESVIQQLAAFPSVIAAAEAAVDNAVATKKILTVNISGQLVSDDAVLVQTDSKRRKIRAWMIDKFGRPSLDSVRAFTEKGVLAVRSIGAVQGAGKELRFSSQSGKRTWIEVGSDGGPTFFVRSIWSNIWHYHNGPDRPYWCWPNNWIHWTQTDNLGNVIDKVKVTNYP